MTMCWKNDDAMERIKAVMEEKNLPYGTVHMPYTIHTNSIYEYAKCKLKNNGWGGGSEDVVCLRRWMDGHADRSRQVSM